MKTKLYLFTMLLTAVGLCVVSSCGNDDETAIYADADDGIFPPVFFNPEEMPEMGVVINYYLYNQNGERTTEFKYGDDIIFDVSIHNLTDTLILIQGERDGRPRLFPTPLLSKDIENGIFNVHTSIGEFVGYPYNTNFLVGKDDTAELRIHTPLDPNDPDLASIRWTASWSRKQYEGFMDGFKYKYFMFGIENEPLLPGKYYTEFAINLTSRVKKTVRIDFTVTE